MKTDRGACRSRGGGGRQNLLVPVGGALIAGPGTLIDAIAQGYPGRASVTPVLDVFVTLLSLGRSGYARLQRERKELFADCRRQLEAVALKHGERLLHTPSNAISLGVSLQRVAARCAGGADAAGGADTPPVTFLGAALFGRCVSGTRVVDPAERKAVGPLSFVVRAPLGAGAERATLDSTSRHARTRAVDRATGLTSTRTRLRI